ncbi:GNAT family N-acetyltransferase [Microvirga arsenatis]|uniref:GNAT family N-acetyltransferase n=1 Tax=Microvirga arsenatis TaxID=2692265 RepID=A0ABW9YY27_9HYPH|nr:N-acetyltransferase [Microvirga arsenatis]NBJ11789.1 GNAT family N-acetyltransferase [Microvirga arsenatis]NBJ25070.1 GNAT family N-acetyltransferase [Microvirga arsenatis]
MTIRLEESTDWHTIYSIYAASFGQSAEADLVRSMNSDGDLILSLVAHADEPAGHIAYSHLGLHETPDVRACVLAPLAVVRSFQKRGIGTALVRHSLKQLVEAGYDLVVVLGEPDYYGRFGFDPKLAEQLKTPYDGPYLQALALSDRGRAAHGPVSYARAFAELK